MADDIVQGTEQQGAEKHAGLEGKTSLECCDATVPVLSVWEVLNAFLASPVDTPILLLLAKLRCPSCQRMIPTFNVITTVTSVDFRKLQQRISIAAQDALDVWPEATITTLLKNGVRQLTDEPWINMRPLFDAMPIAQIQEFLALHLAPPSEPFLNGASQQRTDTPSSDGSLSQYQSEQKRVKPNDDATTDEYTRTALMAQVSSCRKCRDTVKQAAWSVATSAVLSCIRRLLRREVEKGALFEQALLLGGAVAGEPGREGNSASAVGRAGTSTAAATATVTVTAASDGVFSGDEYGDDSDEGVQASVPAKGKKSKTKAGFVKGTGYAGDAKEDARVVQRARAQQAELHAATATIMLHAVDMLHAIVKACLKRDDMLPTFMTGPHAVLMEGGLAHCLHSMLTHQPLDSLVNSPKLLEGQLKLLNAVLLAVPLQATLLMPAGEPPVAASRHDVRVAACGYGGEGPSIADAMQGLERAADVLKGHAMGCNEVNEDGLHVGIDEALNLALYITSTSSRLTENLEDVDELVDLLPAPTHILNGAAQAPAATNGATAASGIPESTAHLRAAHERALRRIGIIYAPLQYCHAFRHEAESMDITSSSAKTRIRDVTKAVTALQGQLPIAWGSSVHVAIDEDRPDLFRVLVIPDQETPYANGAFLFDFILPKDFPNHPPKAKFLTTGGGSVRFNPNLYNCGKVCLSLLGTWQGPSWDPTTSTILQVLVSLQAMVFCRDPYFNEPGYERTAGTSTGDSHSAKYSAGIIFNSMKYAIRAPLENPLSQPHAPFRDILALHWKHKRDSILAHLTASKEDVIKHHGTRSSSLAAVAGGGAAEGSAGMNTVDCLINDITRLLHNFEDRYSTELEKETAQKATVAAEEREKRETDEKERMFQRMQEELAMQTGA